MWFSDTLMGGMTQALRTRPGAGTRRQGYRVWGLLSPGTPTDRHRLCNKEKPPSPPQQHPELPHRGRDVPSLTAKPSVVWPGEVRAPGLGGHGVLRGTEGSLAPGSLRLGGEARGGGGLKRKDSWAGGSGGEHTAIPGFLVT